MSADVRQSCTSIALIAAVSCNWVIGNNGDLPWAPIKEDMAHFRRITSSCPVIMGRRTWESLPERFRPLPGRRNIVVSRNPGYVAMGAETYHSLEDAVAMVEGVPRAFVIGGEQLYRLALPLADEMFLTHVEQPCIGDTFFPRFEAADFVQLTADLQRVADPALGAIDIVHYRRKLEARGGEILSVALTPAQRTEVHLGYLDTNVLHDIRCRLDSVRVRGTRAALTELAKLIRFDYDAEFGLQLTPHQTRQSMLRLAAAIEASTRA